MALFFIGFLLGEKLRPSAIRRHGGPVLAYSVCVSLGTMAIVAAGLWLVGMALPTALVLGGIATATAPAAVMDVIHESRAKGPFTQTLMGIVAVDDAWGLIVFSVTLSIAQAVAGGEALTALSHGAWDLFGAILLGLVLGLPMAYLTGRIQPGEPTLAEALGVVLVCGGVAKWMNVSFLLASMVLGLVVASTAKHHDRPFHAIENIEWPFMILFFILAGAKLDLSVLAGVGVVGAAYVVFRVVGRVFGSYVGGMAVRESLTQRVWMGLSLLPQAGVALGMALVVDERAPELGQVVLPIVVGSTVLFEIGGPIFTRIALSKEEGMARPAKTEAEEHES
jgi:Kef-type K+ transport system membrane component KefB